MADKPSVELVAYAEAPKSEPEATLGDEQHTHKEVVITGFIGKWSRGVATTSE
jgi:hypothetical protein